MDKLKKLILKNSVSGYEYNGFDVICELFKESGAEVFCDKISNTVAIKNKEKGFKLLIDAHFDTIGLMVTEIDDNGFLKFTTVGGVDPRILPSLIVTVHGKEDITGVIGAKPPHLLKDGDKIAYKTEDLFIDLGRDANDVKNIVSCGDIISFKTDYTELLNDKIAASGLDNKVGVFMISEILKRVNNPFITLYGAATVGEEIGLKGAKVVGNSEDFDLVIVIDVTHGLTPDGIKNRSFKLGKGPVLTFGPSLSKKYNNMIRDFAIKNKIEIGIEVESGNTGTNAWAYHSSRCSQPTVMISIPLKYMHTSYEVIDKNDVELGIRLISDFINGLEVE